MLREVDSHATDFAMRYFCRYLVEKKFIIEPVYISVVC